MYTICNTLIAPLGLCVDIRGLLPPSVHEEVMECFPSVCFGDLCLAGYDTARYGDSGIEFLGPMYVTNTIKRMSPGCGG